MLGGLRKRWEAYKYRFVPWIALNLRHKRRTLRFVPEESKDKIASDENVLQTLLKAFRSLFVNDLNRQMCLLNVIPEIKSKYPEIDSVQSKTIPKAVYNDQERQRALNPEEVLFSTLGFSIIRQPSSLESAGIGVFVAKGFVPEGTVVSMYPGTIYENHEPIFFQSIGNPFIFRCIDGVLIDGNNRGISKAIYRSCSKRDQIGPLKMCDVFWLTTAIQNPLAVGQYVNNCSSEKEANVCYQELNIPKCFPVEFKQYLPNINYSHEIESINYNSVDTFRESIEAIVCQTKISMPCDDFPGRFPDTSPDVSSEKDEPVPGRSGRELVNGSKQPSEN